MTSPSPSMFFGRHSRRSTWRWARRSSAASSIVTIRSSSGIARGQRVQQRRLARAGAPRDQDVEPRHHARGEQLGGVRRQRAEADEVIEVEAFASELPDRQQRPGQRQRRDDGVDPAAVGETRVDHRRGLIDPAPDLGDHLVDDPTQMRFVGESHRGLVQPAGALDPDVVWAVDHDLGDGVVVEQPLERAVAEDVVGERAGQQLAVLARDPRLLVEPAGDLRAHPFAQRFAGRSRC